MAQPERTEQAGVCSSNHWQAKIRKDHRASILPGPSIHQNPQPCGTSEAPGPNWQGRRH
jgi:hypothetical protein